MNQIKTLVLKKETGLILAQFAALVGIATLAPLLGQQAITGPIVFFSIFCCKNNRLVLLWERLEPRCARGTLRNKKEHIKKG